MQFEFLIKRDGRLSWNNVGIPFPQISGIGTGTRAQSHGTVKTGTKICDTVPGLKSRGTTTFRDKNPGQSRAGTAFQGFYVTPSRPWPIPDFYDSISLYSRHIFKALVSIVLSNLKKLKIKSRNYRPCTNNSREFVSNPI